MERVERLTKEANRENDDVARAAFLLQLAEAAEAGAARAIRHANRTGQSWREIGTRLGVPYQTLHRRYGEGDA